MLADQRMSDVKGPPLSCDCHLHVFGDPATYPYSADKRNSPPAVPLAEYMAGYFNRCGIPALALTGDSNRELRNAVQAKLLNREINFIFTVDLYNEGVDIPHLDTVLFLRPTESLTVFLQQLGRGLRLHPEKDCLTVLDFIGQARAVNTTRSPCVASCRQTSKPMPRLPPLTSATRASLLFSRVPV